MLPPPATNAPPIWITKTALRSPPPSRVTLADAAKPVAALDVYSPGLSVVPANAGSGAPPCWDCPAVYAASMSLYAVLSEAPTCMFPTSTPGGNPVGGVGAPMSPRTVEVSALATETPLMTAYPAA